MLRRVDVKRASAMLAAAALVACHSGDHRRIGSTPLDAEDEGADASYVAAPQVLRSEIGRGGVVVLNGVCEPLATVRLQAPEGDAFTARARGDGRWSLRMPAIGRPRMFALSAEVDSRVIHAEGALVLMPPPGPTALLVRAGAGALAMSASAGKTSAAPPSIVAIDYDPAGFVAISGLARPRATVRLLLDGAPAGLSRADEAGRYAVMAAGRKLSFKVHVAVVQTPFGQVRRMFRLTPPAPLFTPYAAQAEPDGWRLEWTPSGGGVQNTLVFATPPPDGDIRRDD